MHWQGNEAALRVASRWRCDRRAMGDENLGCWRHRPLRVGCSCLQLHAIPWTRRRPFGRQVPVLQDRLGSKRSRFDPQGRQGRVWISLYIDHDREGQDCFWDYHRVHRLDSRVDPEIRWSCKQIGSQAWGDRETIVSGKMQAPLNFLDAIRVSTFGLAEWHLQNIEGNYKCYNRVKIVNSKDEEAIQFGIVSVPTVHTEFSPHLSRSCGRYDKHHP